MVKESPHSESDIEEFCQVYMELLNLIPKENLEWEANETPKDRRFHKDRHRKLGTIWTTFIAREGGGSISGLNETYFSPDQRIPVYQGPTGVKVSHCSRNLGKWLKAEILVYLRDNFPEVTTIGTDFALVNEPMIAINRKLGFKPYLVWLGYKFQVEDLL